GLPWTGWFGRSWKVFILQYLEGPVLGHATIQERSSRGEVPHSPRANRDPLVGDRRGELQRRGGGRLQRSAGFAGTSGEREQARESCAAVQHGAPLFCRQPPA